MDSLCFIRTDAFSIVPRFKSTSEGSPKPVLAPLLLPNSHLSPTLMADLDWHPLCSSLHQPIVLVHPSYIPKTSERGLQIAYFLGQFMRSRHGYRTKAERLRVRKRLHVESRSPLSKRSALCSSTLQSSTFHLWIRVLSNVNPSLTTPLFRLPSLVYIPWTSYLRQLPERYSLFLQTGRQ